MGKFTGWVILLLAVVIGALSFLGESGYMRLQAMRRNLQLQTDHIFAAEQIIDALEQSVHELKHDRRAIEKAARSELGMARPGEIIVLFDQPLDK